MRPLHCLRELRRGRSVIPHPDNLSILRFLCARELVEQMDSGHVVATELGLHFLSRMGAFRGPPASEDDIEETAIAELDVWVGDRPRSGGTIKIVAVQDQPKATESGPSIATDAQSEPDVQMETRESDCKSVQGTVAVEPHRTINDRPNSSALFPESIKGMSPNVVDVACLLDTHLRNGRDQIDIIREYFGESLGNDPKSKSMVSTINRYIRRGKIVLSSTSRDQE